MNKTILVGNLTKDPNFAKTQSGISYARFTVAVTKKFKDKEETAFVSCVSWGNQADFIAQYAFKGSKVALVGRIVTGSYDDKTTGKKVYTTDVSVEEIELVGGKNDSNQGKQKQEVKDEDFDTGVEVEIDPDKLPF